MNLSKSLCACLRTSCVFSGLAKWLPHNWTYHTVSPVEVGTTARYPDYSTSLASSNMPPCLCRQTGYLAPEYHMHGIVNEKTDVFSEI
ncbi:unnamed protein product [Sphagnum balticum]